MNSLIRVLRLSALTFLPALLLLACTGQHNNARPATPVSGGVSVVPPASGTASNTPIQLTVLTPQPGSRWDGGEQDFLVDIALTSRNSAALGIPPSGQTPTPSPTGYREFAPGLVVLLSSATVGAGSRQNLADLFQISATDQLSDGSLQVRAIWLAPVASYGADADATLTAYVVSGSAPGVVASASPPANALSNAVSVTFHVGGSASPSPSPSLSSTPRSQPSSSAAPSISPTRATGGAATTAAPSRTTVTVTTAPSRPAVTTTTAPPTPTVVVTTAPVPTSTATIPTPPPPPVNTPEPGQTVVVTLPPRPGGTSPAPPPPPAIGTRQPTP